MYLKSNHFNNPNNNNFKQNRIDAKVQEKRVSTIYKPSSSTLLDIEVFRHR